MRHHLSVRGFTLVELLVVIAIIAVLAALLFPLFSVAREKAREIKCVHNQQQIAQAIAIWTQDHDDILPPETDVWQDINISHNTLQCPSYNTAPNGYVLSAFAAGKRLAGFKDTSSVVLTADGKHNATRAAGTTPPTYDNVAYTPADLAFRHGNDVVVSFVDGHVIGTRDPRDLNIELRDAPAAEFDGFDILNKGSWWTPTSQYRYGSMGFVLCNWNGADVTNLISTDPDYPNFYIESVTPSGFTGVAWEPAPSGGGDPRAAANPQTNGTCAADAWSGNGAIAITLKPNPDAAIFNAVHTIHIYCVDWDHKERSMRIDVCSGTSSTSVLKKPISVNGFGEGTWVNIRFRGNVNIRTKCTGGPDAVISAIVFD